MSNQHPIKIFKNYTYIFSNQHRIRQNNNKSIWQVNQNEEFDSFTLMCNENWIIDNVKGWSVHRVNSRNEVLGINTRNEEVKIAKFLDSANNFQWHGYPIDYRFSVNDKPNAKILKQWVKDEIITKTQMRRILQGQGCEI